MFEQPQHNLEPGPGDYIEHTDTLKVSGVWLDIDWHIDVDSPQIDNVYISDGTGDQIGHLLHGTAISEIQHFLYKRMDEMKRETAAWRGQYNNV